MKEHYVSYSQAVKLKELGFDWECDHYYTFQKIFTESRVFPATFKISDFWHNFNEDDQQNRHNQPFYPKCSAPRLDQAQAWLKEVKDLHILPCLENVNKPDYVCIITLMHKESIRITDDGKYFPTYQHALSAGIDATLELLTNKP